VSKGEKNEAKLRRLNEMRHLKTVIFHPAVITLLRVALGLVFIVASLDKIQHPESFATNIANYRLLPYRLINVSAIVLPWIEIVTGTLLVLGVWIRAAGIMTCGMLVMFIAAISQALLRDLDISCGCFSTDPADHRMTRWTLYWNLIWLGWGIIIVCYHRFQYTLRDIISKGRFPIRSGALDP
jgi:uncharacterized membrane protein YphA (DoxX/SURF4 family)